MEKMILALVVLLSTILVYLLIKTIRSSRVNKIDTKILDSFPEITVNFKELAEKTWLKYNDKLYREYVETLEKLESDKTASSELLIPDFSTGYPSSLLEEGGSTVDTPTEDFLRDDLLSSLWEDAIQPYLQVIEEQGALDIIKEGLHIIHEKGNCPSVSAKPKETLAADEVDAKDYEVYKNILAAVSLKEHTVHVVRYAVSSAKSMFKNPEVHIPKILVCSIYHDIGKIPEYRSVYGSLAHPYISGNILSQVAKKFDRVPFWLDEAIQIVKEHHLPGEQNVYKKIIKNADKNARMLEITTNLSGFSIKSFDSWFSVERFLEKLAPLVNEDRFGSKWYAISFKNAVFLRPDRLIDLLETMREKDKLIIPELFSKEDREKVKIKVIEKLSEKDLLVSFSNRRPPNRPVQFIIVLRDGKSFRYNLIPIKITAFAEDVINEIERRKHYSSLISNIKDIVPSTGS